MNRGIELDGRTFSPSGLDSNQEIDSLELGKQSVIKKYCENAISHYGEIQHIWICIKRGRRIVARDVMFPDDDILGIQELRKYCGWFKQHFSLYSAVAVREVRLRFLNVNKAGEIEVVVKPMDFEYVQAGYQDDLQRALEHPANLYACGMNARGDRHSDGTCQNSFCQSDNLEESCLIEYREHLRMNIAALAWLPYMLEFFWQNGIQRKGKEFLEARGFVYDYRILMYDSYCNAREPYGKIVNGFLIVEGWHLRFLLVIITSCLLCSVCIIAVTTAASHSLDAGLAAGSYAVGFGTTGIAVLTFLSAIL